MLNGKRVIIPDDYKNYKNSSMEKPDFAKMTKKALGEWAKENNITVDIKKTKASMIETIKGQL